MWSVTLSVCSGIGSPRIKKENTEVQCTDDVCRSGHMLIQLSLICRFLRVPVYYSLANIGVS